MSYKSNYYINSSSFLTATRVYIDEAMTILAPDGFYSSDIFVRQQVSGILLPFEYCDDCIASCGTSVDVQTDERGEFILDFDTSETGVVVVKFNPYQVPVGIKIEYNGSIYNTALSGRYGELSAGYELPLFLGSESSSCGIDPSPYTLDVYRFSNDDFVYANDYYLLTIQPESLSLTEHTPGTCAIIIPKSSATPESVRVIVYTICDNSEFDLEIDCTPIVDFSGSEVQVSSDDACTAETPNTYYKISMTVDDDMDINIDDFVFSDSLATTLLVEGFYGYSFYGGASGWFEVNEYGMVVDKGVCMTEINNGLLYNWFATTDERGLFAEGWRLSTREENIALGMAIGGPYNEIEEGQIYEFLMAGGEMKSTNIDDWNDPNTGASNSVGFNGKGSGIRESDGNFTNIKNYLICYYQGNDNVFMLTYYSSTYTANGSGFGAGNFGFSLRPVKESTTLQNGESGVYIGNDGKVYPTICIGDLEILACNLAETKYKTGEDIPEIINNTLWSNLASGALCAYDNDWENI